MAKIDTALKFLKKRKFCSAVIVASGSSTRAGRDKIFASLCGVEVLARTLSVFERCTCIDEVILVVRQDKIEASAELCKRNGFDKVVKIVCGGETRMHSALAGVAEVSRKASLIAIHDGARPLVTEELITEVVHNAVLYKAAAPAVAVKDTLKRVDHHFMVQTLSREETAAVQTPQVFEATLIKAALADAVSRKLPLTDDCSAAELFGVKARLVPGSEENLKLTTPLDFIIAEAIMKSREKE